MFALVATLAVMLIFCAVVVFVVAVLISSRRPYLVGAAVSSAFVAGLCVMLTLQTPYRPSVFELLDALYVCEANTGISCTIHWRAAPKADELPLYSKPAEIQAK